MRKQILYIAFLFLFALPVMAEQAIVSVSAGSTRTFTDSDLPDAIRTNAENQGLTFLGWTTSPIADGAKPATYYGTQATVTPATATTYYAFFARRTNSGSRIVRKITTPSDGDTVMLVISQGSASHFVVHNNGGSPVTDNKVRLVPETAKFSDNLCTETSLNYAWKYLVHNADTFRLRIAPKMFDKDYFLYAKNTTNLNIVPEDGTTTAAKFLFVIKDGHPYNKFFNRNLFMTQSGSYFYWQPNTKNDFSTTFSFYRYEWYSDFVTDITDPCPECFMYIAE